MNKSALKTFATKARRELLKKVEARAMKIGITEDNIKKAEIESSDAIFIDGRQLSKEEKIQRNRLIDRVHEIGFKRVMEEVAYTWFNRFTALRFMEVNDYLPTKVRVLSSTYADSTEPDMMKEALSLDLDIDNEYVYELKMNNQSEELFKYLIIKHCNDLNRYMPFMFEKINDYTEILFPDGLLAPDSFVRQMANIEVIPEDNWQHIEVIGWLYQYYIAEEKDRVFKEKKKYKAEEIPFATQLFTPDWIVRYMVQNSLGRYWVESHPEHHELTNGWEFYIEYEEEDFQEKIAPYVNKELNVEDIKCLDPAMGSGHILVYMFDVLFEIYSKCGYMEREIPRLIIENNLYGLDIDDRAYQLACFSVVMKAMEYNRRFLRSVERDGIMLNLASIKETNGWKDADLAYIAGESSGNKFEVVKDFVEQYKNAKTFGSLIKVANHHIDFLKDRLVTIQSNPVDDLFLGEKRDRILTSLPKLIKQTEIMHKQYDVVALNPPYMGSSNMNKELSDFLKKNYPDSKSDLFAAFMEIYHYIKQGGFYAAVNQHSWMFLSSYEKLRAKIINNKFIDTMLHIGPRAFEEISGEVVQSTAFVLRNSQNFKCNGLYIRLIDEMTASEKKQKAIEFIKSKLANYLYSFNQKDFLKIPGNPIAYWVSENVFKAFENGKPFGSIGNPKVGMQTSNNKKYLRLWHEINFSEFNDGSKKWIKYLKGGAYRRWYGNLDYVLWYNGNPSFILQQKNARVLPETVLELEKCTWTDLTSDKFSCRDAPKDSFHDISGHCFYPDPKDKYWLLGFSNTNVFQKFISIINSSFHYQVGDVARIPVIKDDLVEPKVLKLTNSCIEISKQDYDNFEHSWDFKRDPLVRMKGTPKIESAFERWKTISDQQFNQLKRNEEELNRIFIEVYGLQDELKPEVEDKDITIRKADLGRDVKSFISYAVLKSKFINF